LDPHKSFPSLPFHLAVQLRRRPPIFLPIELSFILLCFHEGGDFCCPAFPPSLSTGLKPCFSYFMDSQWSKQIIPLQFIASPGKHLPFPAHLPILAVTFFPSVGSLFLVPIFKCSFPLLPSPLSDVVVHDFPLHSFVPPHFRAITASFSDARLIRTSNTPTIPPYLELKETRLTSPMLFRFCMLSRAAPLRLLNDNRSFPIVGLTLPFGAPHRPPHKPPSTVRVVCCAFHSRVFFSFPFLFFFTLFYSRQRN